MAKITLAQAAAWCGGRVEEKYKQICFNGASNDSRTIRPGQLFVALTGARDGNDFVPAAFQRGAAAVLTSKHLEGYPAIRVDDPRVALGQIAGKLRRHLGFRVVGVTGSVGKSTTKEMIAAVLEGDFVVSKTPANFNNDLGLPMTILGMGEDTQVAVLEMGMSHFGEISYLSHIAKPDIGVITNIGTMHMENLGSRAGILQAKMEITHGMDDDGILLLNGNDALLAQEQEDIAARVAYFGRENMECHIWAEQVKQEEQGLSFTVVTPTRRFAVTLPLEGEHYLLDAMAAVSVGLCLGVSPQRMADRLSRFRNMAGRQEIFQAKGCTIIKDCYNAGPESMEAALKVLGNRHSRRIAVLGDMLELGDCTQDAHRQVGALAAELADVLLAYGPNSDLVTSSAREKGMVDSFAFTDRKAMAQKLSAIAKPGDVLLFKGSHGMHMELVLDEFLQE